jgi:predicted dehydrogenase
MNKKLGIIGAGSGFKHKHADAWLAHPEIELAAVYDAVEQNAVETAERFDIPHIYSSYHELLAREDIDIIDICTPNVFHSEIAIAAMESGKHVLCEKPDAVNPQEAKRMAEAAGKTGKTLMVMRNNRFSPAARFLKKYIEEGHMGEIYAGRCGWIRRRGIPGRGGWFTNKALSGGGPLIDLGVHYIDLAMWLMGDPKPMSVVGAAYQKLAGSTHYLSTGLENRIRDEGGIFDVEDLANGYIRFEHGETLQIEFGWAANIEEETNFLELRGTKAGFELKNGKLKLFGELAGALCDIVPLLPQATISNHAANINHFVDVVQSRCEPIFKPEHGVQMINVLNAIYESSRLDAEVKI